MVKTYSNAELRILKDDARATALADVNTTATSLPVNDTTKFSVDGGLAIIYNESGASERISYTGISGNELTGVTRDTGGSGPVSLATGDSIIGGYFAEHHNAMKEAVRRLANETNDLQEGTDPFSGLKISKVGVNTAGLEFVLDTDTADISLEFDNEEDGGVFEIAPTKAAGVEPMVRVESDETSVEFAADAISGYTKRNLGTASELGFSFEAGVADGGSAVAHELRCINDLANTGAAILQVKNQNAEVFAVRKAQTEVVKLKVTGSTAPLSLPLLGSDPASPADEDMWVTDDSGPVLRYRSGGVTYSIAFS